MSNDETCIECGIKIGEIRLTTISVGPFCSSICMQQWINNKNAERLYDDLVRLSEEFEQMGDNGESVGYYNAAQMVKERLMTEEHRKRINLREQQDVLKKC